MYVPGRFFIWLLIQFINHELKLVVGQGIIIPPFSVPAWWQTAKFYPAAGVPVPPYIMYIGTSHALLQTVFACIIPDTWYIHTPLQVISCPVQLGALLVNNLSRSLSTHGTPN